MKALLLWPWGLETISSHPDFLPRIWLDQGYGKDMSCPNPLEEEHRKHRVVLSEVFRQLRFIPSSSLSSEGLDYACLLAETVTAQAVLISHHVGTGKRMKHPPFSGLHPSHPWLLPSPASTPPPTAGLGAAADISFFAEDKEISSHVLRKDQSLCLWIHAFFFFFFFLLHEMLCLGSGRSCSSFTWISSSGAHRSRTA